MVSKEISSQILIYTDDNNSTRIDVKLLDETVWLSQEQLAILFDKSVKTISEHINNIIEEGELDNSVFRKFRNTASDNKEYLINYYNLDMIIAVGYRVKSPQGTKFRKWATERLKEYLIKGFTLDDKRLEEGRTNKDYFRELIERVRSIRASERNFYQQVTDIYSTSIDYDKNNDLTKQFFATVQNKMHYSVTGNTAAEIIYTRASVDSENMGITTKKANEIHKKDVTIAKNYLKEKEIKELNLLVEQYLAYAELQALQEIPMKMQDWIEKLNEFLKFNGREILENAGKISQERAYTKALKEYSKFIETQIIESDFDKVKKLTKEVKELSKTKSSKK